MLSALKFGLRLVFHGLAGISLILCVTSIMLWGRSYYRGETLHWFGDGRELNLASRRGQVDCYKVWASNLRTTPTKFTYFVDPADRGFEGRVIVLKRSSEMQSFGPYLGFAFFREYPSYAELFVEIIAPWWFLTLVTVVMPCIWVRRWRKLLRAVQPGCCASCGYDLRATPKRCPECGTIPVGAGVS